jgi:CheY-like chemotaxis protein
VTLPPPSLLVVEDDGDLRTVMELMLADAGYRVRTAANGAEALHELARELPELILLDMRMPVMDGWSFAREFRARYDHQRPIIVITAAEEAAGRAAAVEADGYLSKPFELDDLLATVERFLHEG